MNSDAIVLQQIQKNAQNGIHAIELLMEKTRDEKLRNQLLEQSLAYSEYQNKAARKLRDFGKEGYEANKVTRLMQAGALHAATWMNISTGHLAELMMEQKFREMTDMYRSLKQYGRIRNQTTEFAQEFADFEEKSMEELKSFL